jgi:hypothetical protein
LAEWIVDSDQAGVPVLDEDYLVAVVPHTIIRLPRPQLGKFVFSDPKKSFATLSDRPAVLQ